MEHKTRGEKWLEGKGATFAVDTIIHKQKGARHSAEALDYPLDRVIKSLVVELTPKNFIFCLMPGHVELSLRKLARATSAEAPRMADPAAAERLTGYRTGGISPFGSYAELPVFMHESLIVHPEVIINAGHRGSFLRMAPEDIAELLHAEILDLAQ